MAPRTTRITIRVLPGQKALIAARARDAGLSISAYIRRAALPGDTVEDEPALDRLLAAIHASTRRASRAIDEAMQSVHASNMRIVRMERDAAVLRGRVRPSES